MAKEKPKQERERGITITHVGKQETIEEAAENHLQKWRLLNNIHLSNILHAERCKNDFITGAKWQQERMYSKKEVINILNEYWGVLDLWYNDCILNVPKASIWFNQYYKK